MPKLTLKEVRKGIDASPSPTSGGVKQVGMKDFLSKEEVQKLRDKHIQRQATKRKLFDNVDALVGEILGRFGWEVYDKWNNGEIDSDWMSRVLNAERAREKASLAELESVIYSSVVGTVSKHPKKSFGTVSKILESNMKLIKGEKI